jgi:hypothetical protein
MASAACSSEVGREDVGVDAERDHRRRVTEPSRDHV